MPRRPVPIDDLGAKALAQTITRLREERGMSSLQLARASDIAPATLLNVEDRTNEPRWGTLRRIARGLDMELEDLLGQAEHLEREMKQKGKRT
jgi:transcriptional regulator with XRE-family HTH domain